jgi:Beta-lactamase superfamily domain
MFGSTFLGHQGWLIRTRSTSWLVDPLLCESFGQAHALGYEVYPPRVLDPGAFPPIDAVFLTHEHDDHFDIPSLAKLDRKIPIYLSVHSSSAARRILETMGFVVKPLVPGVAIEGGDLELVPFVGDHVATNVSDEWDTLPILIHHKGGDGSFFTMVDITLTERHLAWAKVHVKAPGLMTWTNNALDLSHMASYLVDKGDATDRSFRAMQAGHRLILKAWGEPSALLMCAGGFSFTRERAWLNHRLFAVDAEGVCARMSAEHDGGRFVAATPGQTFWMKSGHLVEIEEATPFLRTRPREEWPLRKKNSALAIPDYAPATGRRTLSDEQRRELESALQDFAGSLVGGLTFRSLHSLLVTEAPPERHKTFCFALRHGDSGDRHVFEYVATDCSFHRSASLTPEESYIAGLCCWESDLLAVLRGELGPIGILFGRATVWNAVGGRFHFDIFEDLYRACHPLRRPEAFFRTYQNIWRSVSDTPITIGRDSSNTP